ncbi:hypothetical protein MXB_3072 [Myxobolus squamalis]|nr:hypothetical protein MXB_3072 [Myxobolus squamalis]
MADYNRREKEKNKIEHVIYQRERSDHTRKLNSLNQEKETFLKSLSSLQEKNSSCQKELESLCDKNHECINLDAAHSQFIQKINLCIESKSRLELEMHVLKSSCSEFNQSKCNYKDQLTAIRSEIKEKESQLLLFRREIRDNKELEALVKERLKSNFPSSFTQDSISTESSIDVSQTQSFNQKISNAKNIQQDLNEKLSNVENKISNSGALIFQSANKRSELIEQKKQLWSLESGLNVNIQEISQKLLQLEKKLNRVIPKDIIDGLKSLKAVLSSTTIVGVYGPLFENLDADAHFLTAIEVTAGIKLFNILVDNSKIATNILKKLKECRLEGQLTFMPLDQLFTISHSPPELDNAIPLISKINFDARFGKAFKLVFEHTLLCRDKQIALTVSRKFNFDGVTLDGDQVHHKGSIVGGYMEQKNKVLDIYSNIKILKQELTNKKNDTSSITDKINKINEEINEISIFLQNEHLINNQLKFSQQNSNFRREYEKLKTEIINNNSEISVIESETYKLNQSKLANKSSESHNVSAILPPNIDFSTINNLSFDQLEEKLKETIMNSCKIVSQINSIESSLNNHLYIVQQELKQVTYMRQLIENIRIVINRF